MLYTWAALLVIFWIATVLVTTMIATIAIAVGTPVGVASIYRTRRKLAPGLRGYDLPAARGAGKLQAGESSRKREIDR